MIKSIYNLKITVICKMKYSVGYQMFPDNSFIDEIISLKDHIEEVYFSWGDFPNGRNLQTQQPFPPWVAMEKMIYDIAYF